MKTQLQSNVRLLRIIDGRMISSDCEIIISLSIDKDGDQKIYENRLVKIGKWIDLILDNSIIYDPLSSSEFLPLMVSELSNNRIISPDVPDDYIMTMLLYSKMNSIGEDYVKITDLTFKSDFGEGFIISMDENSDNILPSLKDWLGDVTYFDKPWWKRSDGGTVDIPVVGDVSDKPDILIDLDRFIDDGDETNNNTNSNINHDAKIIKPSFKPVILNGKDSNAP